MLVDPSRTHFALDALSKLDIKITQKQITDIEAAVIHFETRGVNPLTLNSQMIGVHPIAFTDSDRSALFHVFGVTSDAVAAAVRDIPSIQKEWKVASDPFNVLCEWVMHLAFIYIRQDRVRHKFLMNVAKYLHYRFFTSLVNNTFPHRAVEGTMIAAVNSLSRKFDLVVQGTWRRTIEARCEDLIAQSSIHYRVLQTGSPDKDFIYFLTDTQSRMRDKIKNIGDVYYDFHRNEIAVNTVSSVGVDSEGEKILIHRTSVFDSVITNMCADVMNVVSFVDMPTVKLITGMGGAVSPDLLKAVLLELSETASSQAAEGTIDQVRKTRNGVTYVGMRALIKKLLQTSYSYCITTGVPMSKRSEIYKALKNAYSSSRISDPDIQAVRVSMGEFVNGLGKTKREATLSALRICVILYIVVRSFRYIP